MARIEGFADEELPEIAALLNYLIELYLTGISDSIKNRWDRFLQLAALHDNE